MKKKNIEILVVFIIIVLGIICISCGILSNGMDSNLKIDKIYVYNGDEVAHIEQNDDIFDLLSEEAKSLLDSLDSEISVIDACFTYTGNGKVSMGAGGNKLLEIHLEDPANLMLGGIEHQGIKTLVFILNENTVFTYQDDCKNESESVVGCSYDSADKKNLELLVLKKKKERNKLTNQNKGVNIISAVKTQTDK